MAMNKKEKAELESARRDVELLIHTPNPCVRPPSPMSPVVGWDEYRAGWSCNAFTGKVFQTWRTSSGIAYTNPEKRNGYRDNSPQYATKSEAAAALYCAMRDRFAKELAAAWEMAKVEEPA